MTVALTLTGTGRPSWGVMYFQEFHTDPVGAAQRSDVQMCSEDIVQVFLLKSVVVALTSKSQT